jgi:2-hydroxy-3-oxopropionate reductase
MPVLSAFASEITRAGDVGAGQTAKLAQNLVFALNVFALLEGLTLGIAGGVEPAVLKQIFAQGTAGSAVLKLWDELGPRWKGMLKRTEPGCRRGNGAPRSAHVIAAGRLRQRWCGPSV